MNNQSTNTENNQDLNDFFAKYLALFNKAMTMK